MTLPELRLPAMVAALLLPMSLLAAEPSGQALAEHGSATVAACTSCHGPTGQGLAAAGFPRLAGQSAVYLARQLASFSDGTRANAVMTPIAKALAPADALALANYYASVLPVAANIEPAGLSHAGPGQTLATNGAWSRNLPACAQCHGPQGLGVGTSFPALAGQSQRYLADQLRAWQQGTRTNDALGLMRSVASRLDAAEIDSVARYYADLSPSGTGPQGAIP